MTEEKNEYYRSLAERIVKDVQEDPCKLNSEITREIEKIDRRKPILLVGKDKKLIKHAVNWIHLTHPKVYRHIGRNVSLLARYSDNPISPVISSIENRTIILSEYSCIGKTEQKIEDDLFSPDCSFISDYKSGEMLFVRGLNSKRILERLADSVETGSGVLIINVPSLDIVPQELSGQFDPIYLEPKKQDIPASTPQDTPNRQVPLQLDGWSVSDNKQEVCRNGETVTKLSNILYKLFVCLLNKKGKFVKTETLEKCWDRKPDYDKFLVDEMGKLKATLKKELTEKGINIQGEIIESKKNDKRKIIAYKLPH